MHNFFSGKLTTDMFSGDFKKKVLEFIATDQDFSFMSCVKETCLIEQESWFSGQTFSVSC